jgi:biopolymer transport protein ExbD
MRGLEIGSQVIDHTDLAALLTREMAKRPPDWPVYIEGDRELDFESVAWTIDAVSAFGAKVILLTPSLEADLGERSSGRR